MMLLFFKTSGLQNILISLERQKCALKCGRKCGSGKNNCGSDRSPSPQVAVVSYGVAVKARQDLATLLLTAVFECYRLGRNKIKSCCQDKLPVLN